MKYFTILAFFITNRAKSISKFKIIAEQAKWAASLSFIVLNSSSSAVQTEVILNTVNLSTLNY